MKTQKAGAIILNKNNDSILLLYRGSKFDWSFPKGHIEEGEDDLNAMIRETKEETGLDVDIIKKLPDLEYKTDKNENVSLKFYLVRSSDDKNLKVEFLEDSLEWVEIDKVCEKLSYDNLKEYFDKIKNNLF